MNFKKCVLSFFVKAVKHCLPEGWWEGVPDSGSKSRERPFSKSLETEARNCLQRGVKRAQRPRAIVWMKKARNRWWHTVLTDTLKTETSNFALNPSLHWKPVECSEQCCCSCMPGSTEDKSGCMILYALKCIQFVVRDTSKKRITVGLT